MQSSEDAGPFPATAVLQYRGLWRRIQCVALMLDPMQSFENACPSPAAAAAAVVLRCRALRTAFPGGKQMPGPLALQLWDASMRVRTHMP
eukprot:scaffold265919_cov18-Tisochrysis_lutea.AAC.1